MKTAATPLPTLSCIAEHTAVAFLAGHLEVGALRKIEEHLDGCAGCRRLVAQAGGPGPAGSAPHDS